MFESIAGRRASRGKTRATIERARFLLKKNNHETNHEQESEGGASERVFLAGKNERVLTRLAPRPASD
jgi:hypothetical protein